MVGQSGSGVLSDSWQPPFRKLQFWDHTQWKGEWPEREEAVSQPPVPVTRGDAGLQAWGWQPLLRGVGGTAHVPREVVPGLC